MAKMKQKYRNKISKIKKEIVLQENTCFRLYSRECVDYMSKAMREQQKEIQKLKDIISNMSMGIDDNRKTQPTKSIEVVR